MPVVEMGGTPGRFAGKTVQRGSGPVGGPEKSIAKMLQGSPA